MQKTNWTKIAWHRIKNSGLLLNCIHCNEMHGLDNMEVHLITKHEETYTEARDTVNIIIEALPLDEDGNPLNDCALHGFHRMDYGCSQCDRDSDLADGHDDDR